MLQNNNAHQSEMNDRLSFKRMILFLTAMIIIVVIVSVVFFFCFQICVDSTVKDVWTSSVASYWGGVIGGVVSGVLSFAGVFYTIKYFKESDFKKEQAAVQPFLHVQVSRLNNDNDIIKGFFLCSESSLIGAVEKKQIMISINNIGNGFANTTTIHTDFKREGIPFIITLPVGETEYTFFETNIVELKKNMTFSISFKDCLSNEYIQDYDIVDEPLLGVSIISKYPRLVRSRFIEKEK